MLEAVLVNGGSARRPTKRLFREDGNTALDWDDRNANCFMRDASMRRDVVDLFRQSVKAQVIPLGMRVMIKGFAKTSQTITKPSCTNILNISTTRLGLVVRVG